MANNNHSVTYVITPHAPTVVFSNTRILSFSMFFLEDAICWWFIHICQYLHVLLSRSLAFLDSNNTTVGSLCVLVIKYIWSGVKTVDRKFVAYLAYSAQKIFHVGNHHLCSILPIIS
jgi:hypothetical protein